MGRNQLQAFDIGWTSLDLSSSNGGGFDHGDSLSLVGDKYDMRAFRISDPERNLVLAATDMDDVDKVVQTYLHRIKHFYIVASCRSRTRRST